MTPEAEKALRESIAHWERLASGNRMDGERPAGSQCALCTLDSKLSGPEDDDCDHCLVAEFIGVPQCAGTPYEAASDAWRKFGVDSTKFRSAAQSEVDFLKSLLPEGESA